MWKVAALMLYLVVLSIYDYKEKRVPVVLLAVGAVASVIWLISEMIGGQQIWGMILGMLPGIFLLLVAFVTKKAGYADGIVLAIAGAVLGYQKAVLLFCLSLLLISLVSIALLFFRKVNGRTRIPYLPFLTIVFIAQQMLM